MTQTETMTQGIQRQRWSQKSPLTSCRNAHGKYCHRFFTACETCKMEKKHKQIILPNTNDTVCNGIYNEELIIIV